MIARSNFRIIHTNNCIRFKTPDVFPGGGVRGLYNVDLSHKKSDDQEPINVILTESYFVLLLPFRKSLVSSIEFMPIFGKA